VHDFVRAVVLEAAHQRERWGTEHDAGKTDADWFWLIGYLAGKALWNPGDMGDMVAAFVGDDAAGAKALLEKKLHRIITIAAAAANWHLARSGVDSRMRPGIDAAEGGDG
jgi:hypothetical protein